MLPVFKPLRTSTTDTSLGASDAVIAVTMDNTRTDDCAGLLSLRTLVCKLTAVAFSMGGGLVAGKDGPLIHAGGIVGGGLGGMGSR